MKLKDGFVLRQVAGEYVAIPSGSEVNLDKMITLNETGAFLWEKLDSETTAQALVEALLAEYEVDEQTALSCVTNFVAKLEEYGLLNEECVN